MEYLIGFYVVGMVLTALFISASIYTRPENFRQMRKLDLIGISILTVFIWPVFLGHSLYVKLWKDFKVV